MTTEWEDIQIKLGNMAPKEVHRFVAITLLETLALTTCRPPTDREYDAAAQANNEMLQEVVKNAICKLAHVAFYPGIYAHVIQLTPVWMSWTNWRM